MKGTFMPAADRELGTTLDLKLDANGLFTAVAVDADTQEVLMVAFMNPAALEKTLATGKATYWSRSRQKFWVKGEESGHTQEVQSITIDCDQDAVVLKVKQTGAACHNGFRTCFYRSLENNSDGVVLRTIAERQADPKEIYRK
jgi:phosphoribosyl-AMP cyclohydrolase